jgi:hypothetical protein
MKTIDIKGKEYVMVNERILEFRKLYPTGSIINEMISLQDGVCVFKTSIIIDNEVLAVGHASEKEGSTFINKTSFIENCETSSCGRALGMMGIGIDTSIASAEEVGNAIAQQQSIPKEIDEVNIKNLDSFKSILLEAKKEGQDKLKKSFFEMPPAVREQLREFANDLRTS